MLLLDDLVVSSFLPCLKSDFIFIKPLVLVYISESTTKIKAFGLSKGG